tara:strand:+ start:15123 stop:16619 length:1497 start_codon:yes stop_codon:yes gene_type:complete
MPVNSPRIEYEIALPRWQRCRDCFEGSDAVKARGVTYLPSVASNYDAYVKRAEFYNATARTVMGLLGAVFRSEPTLEFPSNIEEDLRDVTLTAKPIEAFALSAFQEVLITGRFGIQLEMTDTPPPGMTTPRPYWIPRRAEDILSWRTVVIGGQERLSRVVLSETVEEDNPKDEWVPVLVPQVRVLELLEAESENPIYQIRRFQPKKKQVDLSAVGGDAWEEITDPFVPLRKGEPLTYIPFQFFAPSSLTPSIDKPPLLDLVEVNLSHYRTSADHEHGAHLTSLPTPWVSGVDIEGSLPIGSATAWILPEANARAGMLEYTGDGLGSIERLSAAKQDRMAALGARIIEQQKKSTETAEALRIRSSSEYSVLSTMAAAFDLGVAQVMKWHAWWAGVDEVKEQVSFNLNKDFFDTRLDPKEAQVLVAAWQSGAVSHDTLFWNLQQGEWIQAGRTLEEEKELIASSDDNPGAAEPRKLVPSGGGGKGSDEEEEDYFQAEGEE